MKCRTYVSTPLLALALLLVAGEAPAAYRLYSDVYAYATGSDGVPIDFEEIEDAGTGETSFYAAFQKNGSLAENYGGGEYFADLDLGRMSAFGYALGEVINEGNNVYTGTGRIESMLMRDTVTFIVPAGNYEEGVTVSLRGRVTGSFSASPWANVSGRYTVSFPGVGLGGDTSLDSGLIQIGTSDDTGFFIDEPFTLNAILVAPQTTLPSEASYHFNVTGTLQASATAVDNNARPYLTGMADGRLALQYYGIDTPAGITWSSTPNGGSGVFLQNPVPLPAGLPLLGGALSGLALWRGRRGPHSKRHVQRI
ncbi:MAG: VPLPA-CTERM sorting domain-containing protein [Gammaproteobacteria bacterium]